MVARTTRPFYAPNRPYRYDLLIFPCHTAYDPDSIALEPRHVAGCNPLLEPPFNF